MSETGIAKIFMHGRSQAVRLPREFRLPGDRVRVRKVGNSVVLEPILSVKEMFAEIDGLGGEFPPEPEDPPMPPQKAFFD